MNIQLCESDLFFLSRYDDQSDDQTDEQSDGDEQDSSDDKMHTQEDLNRILAEERRKHKKQLEATQKQYEGLLSSKTLDEQQTKEVEANLEGVRKQLESEKNKHKTEKQKLEEDFANKLKAQQEEAEQWRQRFTDVTINHALQEAAIKHEAFNPGQLVNLLRPSTKVVDDKPVVEIDDVSPEGQPIKSALSPLDAVKRMTELTDQYGNLFRSNVMNGLGNNSSPGAPGGGKITKQTLAKMSFSEYEAALKANMGRRKAQAKARAVKDDETGGPADDPTTGSSKE